MSELINVEEKTLIEYFSTGGLKPVLDDIEKMASDFTPDNSTKSGREVIRTQSIKVQKSRKHLEDLRLAIVSDWTTKTKLVNGEGKVAKDFLTKLQADIRLPLTEWEEVEKEKVAKINLVMNEISSYLIPDHELNSVALNSKLNALRNIPIDESFGDLEDQALEMKSKGIASHELAIDKAMNKETEQLELEALRSEKAIRDQRDHEERIAREAEEKAEKEAERKAQIEKERVETEKKEALEREEKLKQEKIDSEKRALELEAKIKQDKIDADKKEVLRVEAEKVAKDKAIEDAKIAERKRIERENQVNLDAEIAREKDLEHRKMINDEAINCLLDHMDKESAINIVRVIAQGKIENITIKY